MGLAAPPALPKLPGSWGTLSPRPIAALGGAGDARKEGKLQNSEKYPKIIKRNEYLMLRNLRGEVVGIMLLLS